MYNHEISIKVPKKNGIYLICIMIKLQIMFSNFSNFFYTSLTPYIKECKEKIAYTYFWVAIVILQKFTFKMSQSWLKMFIISNIIQNLRKHWNLNYICNILL